MAVSLFLVFQSLRIIESVCDMTGCVCFPFSSLCHTLLCTNDQALFDCNYIKNILINKL